MHTYPDQTQSFGSIEEKIDKKLNHFKQNTVKNLSLENSCLFSLFLQLQEEKNQQMLKKSQDPLIKRIMDNFKEIAEHSKVLVSLAQINLDFWKQHQNHYSDSFKIDFKTNKELFEGDLNKHQLKNHIQMLFKNPLSQEMSKNNKQLSNKSKSKQQSPQQNHQPEEQKQVEPEQAQPNKVPQYTNGRGNEEVKPVEKEDNITHETTIRLKTKCYRRRLKKTSELNRSKIDINRKQNPQSVQNSRMQQSQQQIQPPNQVQQNQANKKRRRNKRKRKSYKSKYTYEMDIFINNKEQYDLMRQKFPRIKSEKIKRKLGGLFYRKVYKDPSFLTSKIFQREQQTNKSQKHKTQSENKRKFNQKIIGQLPDSVQQNEHDRHTQSFNDKSNHITLINDSTYNESQIIFLNEMPVVQTDLGKRKSPQKLKLNMKQSQKKLNNLNIFKHIFQRQENNNVLNQKYEKAKKKLNIQPNQDGKDVKTLQQESKNNKDMSTQQQEKDEKNGEKLPLQQIQQDIKKQQNMKELQHKQQELDKKISEYIFYFLEEQEKNNKISHKIIEKDQALLAEKTTRQQELKINEQSSKETKTTKGDSQLQFSEQFQTLKDQDYNDMFISQDNSHHKNTLQTDTVFKNEEDFIPI